MSITPNDSLHKISLVTGRLYRNIRHAQASVHVGNDLFTIVISFMTIYCLINMQIPFYFV